MKKIRRTLFIALIILLTSIIFIANTSSARFADMEYPPNSSGYADFTDEEADKQAEEKAANQANEAKTSEDYVGKSSNNNLKTLEIENAKLEPEFNSLTLDYIVTPNEENTKTIKINAVPEDEKATVEGAGEVQLEDGINKLIVTVRAENGNVKMYNLTINLPYEQSDLRLTSLEIEGINIEGGDNKKERLSPDFSKDTFQYTLTVPYEINGLNVKTQANDGIYVSIKGQDPLEVGKNTVIVELTDTNDETKKTTYVIDVTREEKSEINWLIISISIAVILIVIIVIARYLKNRKKK